MSTPQPSTPTGSQQEAQTTTLTLPEQETSLDTARPEQKKSEIEQISELIAGSPPDTPQEEQGEAPQPTPANDEPSPLDQPEPQADEVDASLPLSPGELAKQMGVTKRALFDMQIQVGSSPDDTMTFKDMKSAAIAHRDSEQDRQDFQDNRQHQENELMVARQRMQGYIRQIEPHLTPQLRATFEQNAQENLNIERANLHRVMPELKDPENMSSFRTDIIAEMQPYGITPQALATITDHRILKYIADNVKMRRRIAKLSENKPVVAIPKNQKTGRSRRISTKEARINKGVGGSRAAQLDAVAALLGD